MTIRYLLAFAAVILGVLMLLDGGTVVDHVDSFTAQYP